jgi:hypothetical protein
MVRHALGRWSAFAVVAVIAVAIGTATSVAASPPSAAADQPERRAGGFFLQTVNGFSPRVSVPAGVVVTDLVFSRTSGGPAACEVQPTFGPSGTYLARFNVAPSEMKSIGLTTGLVSDPGSQVSFVAVTNASAVCKMYVAWSGHNK